MLLGRVLHQVATTVAGLLDVSGVPFGGPVGLVLRNDPAMIAAALGTLLAGRCVVTISPHQGDGALADELGRLMVPAVSRSIRDWVRSGIRDVAPQVGAMGVAVGISPEVKARTVDGLDRVDPDTAHRPVAPGVAVEMLTSGTTGPPKRVPLDVAAFERTIAAAGAHYRADGTRDDTPHLRSGVASWRHRSCTCRACSAPSSTSPTVAASRCSSVSRSTTSSRWSNVTDRRP